MYMFYQKSTQHITQHSIIIHNRILMFITYQNYESIYDYVRTKCMRIYISSKLNAIYMYIYIYTQVYSIISKFSSICIYTCIFFLCPYKCLVLRYMAWTSIPKLGPLAPQTRCRKAAHGRK